MDTVIESYTRRWRFRPGSELRWGVVVLQTQTIFSGLVQSSNSDCGVPWSYLTGDEEGSENEREVRRGKFFSKKFSEKCRVTGKLQRSEGWDNALVKWGPLRQLITELPLSNGWWVLKTRKMCFHFWSSSLSFLSDRITKTGSPNMSDGVQTKCFLWVPQILDDEWWK